MKRLLRSRWTYVAAVALVLLTVVAPTEEAPVGRRSRPRPKASEQ